MTGGGFGNSGHDYQGNQPPGGDPDQTMWGGSVPQPPAGGQPWESPAVDYPQGGYPPPPPAAPEYPPPPPGYPPPPPSYQPGPPTYQPPSYQAPGYQQPGPPGYPQPGAPGYGVANQPYQGGYGYGSPTGGNNTLAIASLVTSLVGVPLWFACYIGILASIAGIVLGIVALNQIKQTQQQGRGMAIAGIAVGGGSFLLAGFFFILALALSSH